MKKQFLLLTIIFFSLVSNAQTSGLLYGFGFDNTLQCDDQPAIAFNYYGPIYKTDKNDVTNGAVEFTRVTNVSLPQLPQGNSARSISVWVKFPDLTTSVDNYIWSYGAASTYGAYGLYVRNSGFIRNFGWANDLDLNYALQSNVWYNFVTTYDGTKASVYVNGTKVGSGNFPNWNTNGTTLYVGQSPNGTTGINAHFDDLKIFNTALDSAAIVALYQQPVDTTQILNSLISYYSFENKLTNQASALELTNNNNVQFNTSSYHGAGVVFNESNSLTSTAYSNLIPTASGQSFTISFYKKDAAAPSKSYPTFFELFASYYFRYNAARKNEIGFAKTASSWIGTYTNNMMFQQNVWRNITIVHDGTTYIDKIYYDGQYVLEFDNDAMDIYSFNNVFSIGGGTNASGALHADKYYKGEIDELYIFNRALSVPELRFVQQGYLDVPQSVNTSVSNIETSDITIKSTNNEISIDSKATIHQINIYTLSGSLVKTVRNINNTTCNININELNNGIYIIRTYNANGIQATKLQINK